MQKNNKNIEAIILLAGFGRRMQPLSKRLHKTLIPIAGISALDRIINALLEKKISAITLVLGYQAEKIKEHVQQHYPNHQFNFLLNNAYQNTNNIVSLNIALENIHRERVLIIEGDLIFNKEVIEKAISESNKEIALVDDYHIGHDGTVLSVMAPNDLLQGLPSTVLQIFPPRLQQQRFQFYERFKTLNIYCFSRKFICEKLKPALDQHIKHSGTSDYYEEVIGVLLQTNEIELSALHVLDNHWEEIDDPLDVDTANYTFDPDKRIEQIQSHHGGYWSFGIHDLCYPKNNYFPSASMLNQMQHHLPELITNYGSSQKIIEKKLALLTELDAELIVGLNGLSQVYPVLGNIFKEGVFIPAPSFGEYQRCFKHAENYVDSGDNYVQWQQILPRANTIIIVNPNNPTGSYIDNELLAETISSYKNLQFIVDESFIDFSEQKSLLTFPSLKYCENLLVLKSLGKYLGIPGLRLGFAYSPNKELLGKIRETIPIWNNNSLAEYFLELSLKNKDAIADSLSKIKADRLQVKEQLIRAPWVDYCFSSQCNFYLLRLRLSEQQAHYWENELLAKHNILIKLIRHDALGEYFYLRFPLTNSVQNEINIKLLEKSYRQLFKNL